MGALSPKLKRAPQSEKAAEIENNEEQKWALRATDTAAFKPEGMLLGADDISIWHQAPVNQRQRRKAQFCKLGTTGGQPTTRRKCFPKVFSNYKQVITSRHLRVDTRLGIGSNSF